MYPSSCQPKMSPHTDYQQLSVIDSCKYLCKCDPKMENLQFMDVKVNENLCKSWRRTFFRVGKYIPLWKHDCNSLLISKFANKLRYVMRSYWFDRCHKQAGPASASSPTAWAPTPTPTWPTAASPKEICYLSPITRRRSDMSTWPKLTTTFLSFLSGCRCSVFCARCRNLQQEEDDRKSQVWVCQWISQDSVTWPPLHQDTFILPNFHPNLT